ncbi:MAG: flagellar biosynthetic protein FliR [Burkholderiaceae bacterium]|nr:MAG: flagellar biosynthetic protein FliR [Burkholderiaceae bacterium]
MFTFSEVDIQHWLSGFVWPFVRVLALFTAAPVFSHTAFPKRARIGLALLITFVVAPLLPVAPPQALFSPEGLILLIQQLLVGAGLGFAMKLVFAAIEGAGTLVGFQMGLGFATFIDPQHNQQTPIVGSFLGVLASLVFFSLDGHLILLSSLVESFTLAPIATNGLQQFHPQVLVSLGEIIFSLGLHISLPMVGAIMIANIALGLLSRAAPQLNIFAVGFPVTLMIGFWSLWMSLPFLGGIIEAAFKRNLLEFIR